jgi:hypothetical protein
MTNQQGLFSIILGSIFHTNVRLFYALFQLVLKKRS